METRKHARMPCVTRSQWNAYPLPCGVFARNVVRLQRVCNAIHAWAYPFSGGSSVLGTKKKALSGCPVYKQSSSFLWVLHWRPDVSSIECFVPDVTLLYASMRARVLGNLGRAASGFFLWLGAWGLSGGRPLCRSLSLRLAFQAFTNP